MSSQSPQTEQDLTIHAPENLEKGHLYLRGEDWPVAITLGAITLYAWSINNILGFGVFLFSGFLFAGTDNRRMYLDFWLKIHSAWLVRVRKRVLWKKGSRSRPYPFTITNIASEEQSEHAVVKNADNGTDTLYLMGYGSRFPTVGIEGQRDYIDTFSDYMAEVAAIPTKGMIGLSLLFCRRPLDETRLDHSDNDLHPNVLAMRGKREEDITSEQEKVWFRLWQEHQDSKAIVKRKSCDLLMVVAITMKRESRLRAAVSRDVGISRNKFHRSQLVKVAKAALTGLQNCDVYEPRFLTAMELHRMLRRSHDVANYRSYDQWHAKHEGDPRAFQTLSFLPQLQMLAHHTSLQVDGSYHSVVQLTKNPPKIHANDSFGLLSIKVPNLVVACVGKMVRSGFEYHAAERKLALGETVSQERGVVREGARKRKKKERAETRQEVISESPFTSNYARLLLVSSTDPEMLEDDVGTVISATMTKGPRLIKEESRQLKVNLTAMTGINLL